MEKTVYEKWNNIVIENHSPEMGKNIIQWWKSKGVKTSMKGDAYKGIENYHSFLYGIIDGLFSNHSERKAKMFNARILQWSEVEAFEKMKEKKFKTGDPLREKNTLLSTDEILSDEPEKEWIPEYGERVLVWDENESLSQNYHFHSKTNGLFWVFMSDPVFVNVDYSSFQLLAFKCCKPLPKEVWLTAEEISVGKGTGVDPKLIRFKA